jgi:hypothetical protein
MANMVQRQEDPGPCPGAACPGGAGPHEEPARRVLLVLEMVDAADVAPSRPHQEAALDRGGGVRDQDRVARPKRALRAIAVEHGARRLLRATFRSSTASSTA